MARRPSTFSSNSVRVAPRDAAAPSSPQEISETVPAAGDQNIHIDAKTGHVIKSNADGSATITPIASRQRKPRRDIKRFDDNLAEDMDDSILATIATRLLEGIENDEQSRREWEQTCQKGANLIGVNLEEAAADLGSDGMIARVKHTALLTAVITSWANSRSELLPVGGPVKVRDDEHTEEQMMPTDAAQAGPPGIGHNGGPPMGANVVPGPGAPPAMMTPGAGIAGVAGPAAPHAPPGPPQPGAPPPAPAPPPPPPQPAPSEKRNQLADDLETDMNHYLTVVDPDYYPDCSRMLVSRALLGVQFRKVYRDPILKRPVSRWVKGVNLIVSNEATSLAGAARVTEHLRMRQGVVKRLMKIEHWRDVSLVIPTGTPTPMEKKIGQIEGVDPMPKLPADQLHDIFECYTDLDEGELGKDDKGKEVGWPLPYRITIDKDSRQVLEIRRNWKEDDELYLKKIRYVKFGHVPGLGFYDWGYVHLAGNPQRAATMIEKCLIDTGMLNSYPGGIMARSPGTRQRTTEVRPGLGEFIVMDTGGLPIQDFVMPWPYKEPSAVLQAVGADVVAQIKAVSGQVELPVGEGRIGNTPVGTIMAYIEAVSKVPSAVHKDDHIAQQQEFQLLKELFAEDPSALWKFSRKPSRRWAVAKEISDQDLVPAADPNVPSAVHRLMQTQVMVTNAGLPQFAGIPDQRAIWERSLRSIGASNTGEYTMKQQAAPPPPPDPRIVAAQIKSADTAKTLAAKAQDDQQKTEADLEKARIESADKDADRESEERRAAMAEERSKIEAHVDMVKHVTGIAADHVQHVDKMHQGAATLVQDHVQHLQGLNSQAQSDAAQTTDETPPDASGIAQPGPTTP